MNGGERDPGAQPAHHPSRYLDLMCQRRFEELAVAIQKQRVADLWSVAMLAAAAGIALDVEKAVRSHASATDLLAELRDELLTNRAVNGALRPPSERSSVSETHREVDLWGRALGLDPV